MNALTPLPIQRMRYLFGTLFSPKGNPQVRFYELEINIFGNFKGTVMEESNTKIMYIQVLDVTIF